MLRRRAKFFSTTGVTLIEVMVTLTILGFILLIIFGAFRLGFSAWGRGELTKEEYQKVRILTHMISQQIKSIVPHKIKTQKPEGDYLAFEGDARSLKFVSAQSIKAKQPEGLVYVIYQFEEGGDEGGRFILYEQRALNKNFFEEEVKKEIGLSLLEGVTNVRFEYYQEEDPAKNRKEGWVEQWNAREERVLPRLVRLTIAYPAYQPGSKDRKSKGENSSVTVMASIPSYRLEEVRIGPIRRAIPRIPPGGAP